MQTLPALLAARIAAHAPETILRRKERGIWRAISWSELGARLRAIGCALRADGIQPGEVVGIISEATPDWIAADLAILSIGGVSLGLTPTDAGPAVAAILQDSGCTTVFVEGEEQLDKVLQLRESCPALKRIIIMDMKGLRDFSDPMCVGLDSLAATGEAADRAHPTFWDQGIAAIAPENLAVLAYTAGTTGAPRGVMLTHRNIMAQLEGAAAMTGLGPQDERLAFLPPSQITERVLGLYLSLHARAVSNLVENAETVPENLAEVRPTVMIAIPRVWQKFYARVAVAAAGATRLQSAAFDWALATASRGVDAELAGRSGQASPLAGLADALVLKRVRATIGLDRLRVAWVGGAPVSPALLRWYRVMGIDLREVYGLTECGGLATATPQGRLVHGSVGATVAHGEIAVSPEGEVLVRGAHVCAGYWRDEAATSAAFADGWLRTGDLGRLEGGMLTLAGRTEDVLTLPDGSQLSPATLENELALSPYIADALVLQQAGQLTALLMVEQEALEGWAQQNGIAFTAFQGLLRAPEALALVAQAVEAANGRAPGNRRIARFRLLDRALGPDDPELTPMMKLRRAVVLQRFRPLVDEMAAEERSRVA
ncbi:MAG: AMP-binding protein [Alphaproteobacteria bacterium]|nr:AMP-binding protein [Alphaproteobacteria bacterium]